MLFGGPGAPQGRPLESLGDPQLLAIGGGVVVKKDVAGIGGIGVGGLPSREADEESFNAGLKALNL